MSTSSSFDESCKKHTVIPEGMSAACAIAVMMEKRPSPELSWTSMKSLSNLTVSIRAPMLSEVLPEVYACVFDYSMNHPVPDICHWCLLIPRPFLYDLFGVSCEIIHRMYDNPSFRDMRLIIGPDNDDKQILAFVYDSIDCDENWVFSSRHPDHVILFDVEC